MAISATVGSKLARSNWESWKGIKNTLSRICKASMSYMELNIRQLSSAKRLATNPPTIPAGIVMAPFSLKANRKISFINPNPERDVFRLSPVDNSKVRRVRKWSAKMFADAWQIYSWFYSYWLQSGRITNTRQFKYLRWAKAPAHKSLPVCLDNLFLPLMFNLNASYCLTIISKTYG